MKKVRFEHIDLIVYDFDGVLTDNKVLVFDNGQEAVLCNRSDGLAIEEIKKLKIPQLILSAEKNNVVKARAEKLDIEAIYGVDNKCLALSQYCEKNNVSLERVLYIGNDLNDFEVMKSIGFPLAPLDANMKIKNIARIVMKTKGGEGLIRELLTEILEF